MKTLIFGILYFIAAFSSLYLLNPEVDIYAILMVSSIATTATVLLFLAVSAYIKRRQPVNKSFNK
ncbi:MULTISPECIES: hypothetical protein [Sphingobacterium]|uniref:hypothetical protein n=1 Tax=Sphingobacterium TaxID=28453 RepID=UPI0013DC5125|nr:MULTISPECIES: hypothetical protein [unclassified Sphingobacterium]